MKKISFYSARGFTLIELIVSVALFAVVMVIVGAAYLNLINLDRRTRAETDLVNNLSFAVDSISRAIRTGSNYACTGGGTFDANGNGTCTEFSFVDANKCAVTYAITSGTIRQTGGDGTGGTCLITTSTLIDPKIYIGPTSDFYVNGVGTSDYFEPQVVFTVAGAYSPSTQIGTTTFTIETTATERGLDIP